MNSVTSDKSKLDSASDGPCVRNGSSAASAGHERLGEWYATAICGNDITSSCLYVSALSLLWAGPWAPVSLLMVAFILWLFRGIYTEVVEALPLNGGAYNALLNTTSKFRASIAACLTILSYLATAVISASEASHYISAVLMRVLGVHPSDIQIIAATIALLLLFAVLTIRGIGESARVALGIFLLHMGSLMLLLLVGGLYVWGQGLGVLLDNFTQSPPFASSAPLFFGFAVAMLGISGFESSSNFVEEQKPGVFPKTLRNMWLAVSFFNPMMALLALAIVPLGYVRGHQEALLAYMGHISGGPILEVLISVDAAIVLSGAVLTSFVGVTGLVHRMTLDRCLPQLLLKQGDKNTFYRIILLFFMLSSGLLMLVGGHVDTLAGVYTISFLGVMGLFVMGNIFLKIKRSRLPRTCRVNWLTLAVAFVAVCAGVVGNIALKLEYVQVFLLYFIPTVAIVMIMLWRIRLLKAGVYLIQAASAYLTDVNKALSAKMEESIDEINSQVFVFFTRGDNIANLNQVMLYIRDNELTSRLKVVTVVQDEGQVPPGLSEDLDFLNKAYPDMEIEFVVEPGRFSPEKLQQLSQEWNIPLNFMFIGSPGDRFPHRISDLGGVRLII
jgi:amino acid transporter